MTVCSLPILILVLTKPVSSILPGFGSESGAWAEDRKLRRGQRVGVNIKDYGESAHQQDVKFLGKLCLDDTRSSSSSYARLRGTKRL